MKAVLISTAVLLFVGAVTGATLMYAQRQAAVLPDYTPAIYLASRTGKTTRPAIVFVGDSLTHGAVSASYVDILRERGLDGYEFINAGVNSELAYNINNRIDEIAVCDPDLITILIGTNDAKSTASIDHQERSMKDQNLPKVPDAEWFRENIKEIAEKLKSQTDARIAFLSLPTMGEDREHPVFALSGEYSRIIEEVAADASVSYLPLHETMVSYLDQNPSDPVHDFSKMRSLMMKSILRRYLLGQSWNKIGETNGFALHTDHLHLNDEGAGMIADLIMGFVLGFSG